LYYWRCGFAGLTTHTPAPYFQVMTLLMTYTTALLLGSLHALEADHMAAVTSFAVRRPGVREAVRFGVRWSLGHGGAIVLVGAILILAGVHLPEVATHWLERMVGVVMIALGIWTVRGARALHAHVHSHADGTVHSHLHSHAAAPAHDHGHGVTAVGLMHGLAGSGSAVALIPLVAFDSPPLAVLYLVVFAAGTIAAMAIYGMLAGVVVGRAAESSVRLARPSRAQRACSPSSSAASGCSADATSARHATTCPPRRRRRLSRGVGRRGPCDRHRGRPRLDLPQLHVRGPVPRVHRMDRSGRAAGRRRRRRGTRPTGRLRAGLRHARMGRSDMKPDEREALRRLLRERSVRTGDFTLASGRRSHYYIDARLTTMSGAGQHLIGRCGLAVLDELAWAPAALGGLTLGADPVAYAIAHAAADGGRTLDAFTVRKEPKAHGTGRLIEGNLAAGTAVVVVEDVITTGDSALKAVRAVEEAGARVIGVLAVVDRQEGGRARIEGAGHPVAALFTAAELLGRS
jgi:orotate phosphoribosyltransferase